MGGGGIHPCMRACLPASVCVRLKEHSVHQLYPVFAISFIFTVYRKEELPRKHCFLGSGMKKSIKSGSPTLGNENKARRES